jgi:hypothetical protein
MRSALRVLLNLVISHANPKIMLPKSMAAFKYYGHIIQPIYPFLLTSWFQALSVKFRATLLNLRLAQVTEMLGSHQKLIFSRNCLVIFLVWSAKNQLSTTRKFVCNQSKNVNYSKCQIPLLRYLRLADVCSGSTNTYRARTVCHRTKQKNNSESLALVKDNDVGCNYFKVTSLTTPIGKGINSIPLKFSARQ